MKNEFKLKFNSSVDKLSGNALGRSVFESQVSHDIDYSTKIKFIFPECIDNIGTSFIHGFFEALVRAIGVDGIENQVEIEAEGLEKNQSLKINNAKDFIMKKLYLY